MLEQEKVINIAVFLRWKFRYSVQENIIRKEQKLEIPVSVWFLFFKTMLENKFLEYRE